jgi:hypothetical protein
MPILRYMKKIGYFAHIPKCAGNSVYKYINSVGIKVAFLDKSYFSFPATETWNLTTPQHIDGYSLARLFPSDFFDFSFAIVRNLILRFISAYNMQTLVENKIDKNKNINEFIESDLTNPRFDHKFFDNHFREQTKFIMPNIYYEIFKLENGLGRVQSYIESQLYISSIKFNIGHENKAKNSHPETFLTKKSKDILSDFYKQDFEKLQYEVD